MIVLQDAVFIAVLVLLAVPLGLYIHKVMTGKEKALARVMRPVEMGIYRLMRIAPESEMSAKRYAFSVLMFSGFGLIFVFLFQMLQGVLPFNPEHLGAPSWHLAFNTAASYASNTNWQAYAGETTLSYFTQATGLAVQNFLSAAVGISVLFVLMRGFSNRKKKSVGNFWVDLTRTTLYILLPLSLLVAVVLVSQGVVQSFDHSAQVTQLQSGAAQIIPLGPAASQIAIKQLGTNGGGFFGMNSAFPLENPTPLSNFVQALCIMTLPASLCVTFGEAVRNRKQGVVIFASMLVLFVLAMAAITASEQFLAPQFAGTAISGNMEGKEVIHGVGSSALWGAATTAASNGSVNAMHDSFTPIGGMVLLFQMQLGEIIFGGVGSGLYGMIAFVLLTVFIAGLMVGRTPEFLGKKIEPFDMKMVCVVILMPPLLSLLGTAAAVSLPAVSHWLGNSGAHGFSEVLYAFTSMANNNGSAFAGFQANSAFTNITGGLIMLVARFIPMAAVIYLGGHLSAKKAVAASEGTFTTNNATFGVLLIAIILIIGALTFLPALALGPIAEFLSAR